MEMSIAEKSKKDIVKLLYDQSTRVSVSHPVAAFMMATWFSLVSPINELIVWIGAICFFSAVRPLLKMAFTKHHNSQNTQLWIYAWVLLSFILGCTYSVGFIYFTPLDNPTYIMSVGMFVTSFSAAAVIGYGASKLAMLGFFLPVTIPSVVYFGLYGGTEGFILSAGLLFFTVVVLSLLSTMSDAFKKSIHLNHQNQIEIEKRKQIEKQLQDISRRDGLTGLFNRRYFDEMLNTEIGRAHRNHSPLCLLMFDIDCFKEYNDEYGHVAGDTCLVTVGEIVEKLTSRKGDIIARYGGEEFAVILPNTELEGAIAFGNKLQKAVQAQNIKSATTQLTTLKCVTVSVGVTNLMPFKRIKAKEFIEAADRALYEAKRQGRNRVHYVENTGFSQGRV